MFIRVSGVEFTALIQKMVKSKEIVNFTVKDKVLYLQTAGQIIYDAKLPVLTSDVEGEEFSYSAEIDKSVHLLNPKQEVTLTLVGDLLMIEQGSFSYMAEQAFEGRVETNAFDINFDKEYSRESLKQCVTVCKSLDLLARIIGVSYAPVTIFNKIAYHNYSNSVVMSNVDLPDMTVALDTLKKISGLVDGAKESVCHEEGSVLYFYVSEDEVLSVTISEPNKQMIETMNNVVNACLPVTTIGIKEFAYTMQKIVEIYPKSKVNLGIIKDGLNLFVDNTSSKLTLGNSGNILCGIQISTAQLSAIQKVFGEYEGVEVLKGDNKLCLRLKNSGRTLLIAGLVY